MTIRVIFSDMHFGDSACSLSSRVVTEALRGFLRDIGPIEEIVLAGDILDVNISSFTNAIEGSGEPGDWPKQIGFRRWLAYLFEDDKLDIGRIVYIPGNHDYKVWDILSTYEAFVEPHSRGEVPKNLPLMRSTYEDPFIKGIAPLAVRDHFVVIYPDYEFDLVDRRVFVTHGHYLDWTQNLSTMNLEGYLKKEGKGDTRTAIRKFFIATAQHQALANIFSYKTWSRKFATVFVRIFSFISSPIFFLKNIGDIFRSGLKNKAINARILQLIEVYLYYFSQKNPDIFIFGHTHKAGRRNTYATNNGLMKKKIEVWNCGGFIKNKDKDRAGTFIVVDDGQTMKEQIKLFEVNLTGSIMKMTI